MIQKLEKEFHNGSYTYSEAYRKGRYAIYYQIDDRTNSIIAYEVFRIIIRPAETVYGINYPKREVVPSSEQWGKLALTEKTMEDTGRALDTIIKYVKTYGDKLTGRQNSLEGVSQNRSCARKGINRLRR